MLGHSVLSLAANNVTSSMDTSIPIGERLKSGGETLVLGVATVFLVLAVIWLILEFSSWIFSHDFKKKKESSDLESDMPKESELSDGNAMADVDGDDRLVAVITAAVASYIDAEESVDNQESKQAFKVVSFKRLG